MTRIEGDDISQFNRISSPVLIGNIIWIFAKWKELCCHLSMKSCWLLFYSGICREKSSSLSTFPTSIRSSFYRVGQFPFFPPNSAFSQYFFWRIISIWYQFLPRFEQCCNSFSNSFYPVDGMNLTRLSIRESPFVEYLSHPLTKGIHPNAISSNAFLGGCYAGLNFLSRWFYSPPQFPTRLGPHGRKHQNELETFSP